ncbi:hypothetical protein [Mycolicibacterium frederiksbergense]|nr:hypothetical protein [Mycolicibacterium frederiksbergense]
MSYMQALRKVTETDIGAEASTPLHIRSLLNISSAEDIAARHRDATRNMTVPVGISASGDTATLNIAHAAVHPEGVGPHGAITGPGALDSALTLALALRANNGAERVQVAFAGPEGQCRTAAPAVDQVVATPWHEWLRAELTRRLEIAHAAQVTNVYDLEDVPSLVVLLAADGGHVTPAEEVAAMAHAVRTGRSLGVHVILISPDPIIWRRHSAVTGNLTFHVTLGDGSGRHVASADTFDAGQFTFSPAQLGGGELAGWITTVRQAS